ncbi:MAG: hypothetical protein M3388_14665 [Acidobacteriota bacterium]|nr:hypothetical protein [Acidobacteriota bacterium]
MIATTMSNNDATSSVTFPRRYKVSPYSVIDGLMLRLDQALRGNEEQGVWTKDYQSSAARKKFEPLYKKLRSFSALINGWDGYNAEKPNLLAIARTRSILTKLEELNFVPTDVCPSVEGGTSIYFIKGNKYADFEFFNSGENLAGMSDRVDEPIVLEVDFDGIETSIERIQQFLND